jgi:DNA-binding transcriptional LysR family regulator
MKVCSQHATFAERTWQSRCSAGLRQAMQDIHAQTLLVCRNFENQIHLKSGFRQSKIEMLNFDMDALRTMVVGIELGGFSHAALRLNRSPSAVSMQLRKLESQAGQRLFRRNGRTLKLTEAGDVLLQYARRVLALNDEMGFALGAISKAGTVRIGMPQDFAHAILETLLVGFSHTRPDVHVEVKAGRNYELASDVSNGRLDIAIAFTAAGKGGANRIATIPTMWVRSARHKGNETEGNTIPLVVFDGPCMFRDMAINTLSQGAIPWRFAMTTPSLAGLWCGVRAGLGVTARTAISIPQGLVAFQSSKKLPPLPSTDIVLYCAEERPASVDDFRVLLLETLKVECARAQHLAKARSRPRLEA